MRNALLAALAASVLASPLAAKPVNGVDVVQLGTPSCWRNNLPTATDGAILDNQVGSNQTVFGPEVDPAFPWSAFRGRVGYNALFGSAMTPSRAYYTFAHLENSIRFVDGTVDPSDRFSGFDADGLRVFTFSGADLNAAFPSGAAGSLNAEIIPAKPIAQLVLSTRSASLEFVVEPGSFGKCD